MLSEPWPAGALFVLRHALFLGPLAAAVLLMARTERGSRRAVGAFFSLLYGLALVFVGHTLAVFAAKRDPDFAPSPALRKLRHPSRSPRSRT